MSILCRCQHSRGSILSSVDISMAPKSLKFPSTDTDPDSPIVRLVNGLFSRFSLKLINASLGFPWLRDSGDVSVRKMIESWNSMYPVCNEVDGDDYGDDDDDIKPLSTPGDLSRIRDQLWVLLERLIALLLIPFRVNAEGVVSLFCVCRLNSWKNSCGRLIYRVIGFGLLGIQGSSQTSWDIGNLE